MGDSYYEVLGISRDASEEDIERAYREKVKEHHPDCSDAPNAQEKFQQVREAKETLLTPTARQRYDRKLERDAAKGTENEARNTSNLSSEEWARQQRRRERQRHRRQQAKQRQQRWGRREQRQQWNHSSSADREEESGSWTRAGRQTETRTRHRESTSSWDRERRANRSIHESIRAGFEWVRTLSHRQRRAVRAHVRSPRARPQLLLTLAMSPTTIRLGAATALMMTLMHIASSVGLSSATSPEAGFVIVVGSLIASYATYAVVSPLPFEEPRTCGRFKPASRSPLWQTVAMNLTPFGLFGLAAINGADAAGIAFTTMAGLYAAILLFGFSLGFTIFFMMARELFTERITVFHTAKYAIMIAPVGAAFVMFTRYGGDATLRASVQSAAGVPASTAPWIPPFSIGPLYLGLFLNFVLALTIIGCLFGSILAMCWYLTVVPWNDRYDHGYRVRPTIWNLFVAVPLSVLGWMVLADIPTVAFGPIALPQSSLWIGVSILPSVLVGAYIVRRQIEPRLQQCVW